MDSTRSMHRALFAASSVALWIGVFARPAGAQTPATPAAQSSDPSTPAAVPHNVQDARDRIARGEQLFERGDYVAALTEFEQAYTLIGPHPQRYLVHYNIAQSYERLFRYDEALRAYRRYLDEGGEAATDRAAVEATMRTLEGMLAVVHVRANVRAEVWVDDHHVGDAPGDVRVPGGRHVVELRARGYESQRRELVTPARTEHTLALSLAALASEYRGMSPVAFWITTGAAALTLGAGVVIGSMALVQRGRIDDQLADDVRRWDVTDADRSRVRSLGITADVLFATGAALSITALVLAFMTNFHGEGRDGRVRARVEIAPGRAGVSLGGTF